MTAPMPPLLGFTAARVLRRIGEERTRHLSHSEQNGRVLIVDDQSEMIELLELVLASRGYEVDTALGVRDACVLLDSTAPDLVITDLEMPGHDGFELLRIVQDSEHCVPVIALTGTADERLLRRARASGFREVLAKPYDSALMFSAIGRALALPA
jgi:two-component system, chemotaxis family, chemotaxis protein CheY